MYRNLTAFNARPPLCMPAHASEMCSTSHAAKARRDRRGPSHAMQKDQERSMNPSNVSCPLRFVFSSVLRMPPIRHKRDVTHDVVHFVADSLSFCIPRPNSQSFLSVSAISKMPAVFGRPCQQELKLEAILSTMPITRTTIETAKLESLAITQLHLVRQLPVSAGSGLGM
jgi:hypothetical protein